jgi:uncharacterized BrkB/YihY/UPF0761 family membrane protein
MAYRRGKSSEGGNLILAVLVVAAIVSIYRTIPENMRVVAIVIFAAIAAAVIIIVFRNAIERFISRLMSRNRK